MNPVDTATLAPASPTTTTSEIAGSSQTTLNTAASQSLLPVTKELAAMQESVQTLSTAATSTNTMQKVLEVLVASVQALVGAITALVSGGKLPTAANPPADAPSASASKEPSPSKSTGSSTPTVATTSGPSSNTAPVSRGSSSSVPQSAPAQAGRSSFDVTRNDIGQVSVRTLDGFLIRAEGKEEAWTITGPDGKTTRIWGDPHVKDSDGKRWDFLNRSTFRFGNNKATVEVVPAGNGTTLTSRITIYSGSDRVTIDGIDKNRPNVVAVSSDGRQHDDGLADGVTYKRSVTNGGEAWTSNLTGKVM